MPDNRESISPGLDYFAKMVMDERVMVKAFSAIEFLVNSGVLKSIVDSYRNPKLKEYNFGKIEIRYTPERALKELLIISTVSVLSQNDIDKLLLQFDLAYVHLSSKLSRAKQLINDASNLFNEPFVVLDKVIYDEARPVQLDENVYTQDITPLSEYAPTWKRILPHIMKVASKIAKTLFTLEN